MLDQLAKFVLDTHLLQFLLTLAIWAVIGFIAANYQPIPQLLQDAGMISIGYWFGVLLQAKTNERQNSRLLGKDEP